MALVRLRSHSVQTQGEENELDCISADDGNLGTG